MYTRPYATALQAVVSNKMPIGDFPALGPSNLWYKSCTTTPSFSWKNFLVASDR